MAVRCRSCFPVFEVIAIIKWFRPTSHSLREYESSPQFGSALSKQNQIVPVYQLRLIHITKDVLDLATGLARHTARLMCAVVHQAASNVGAIRIKHGNNRTALKPPADLRHA